MQTEISTVLILLALGILFGAINLDRNSHRTHAEYSSQMQDSMDFLRRIKGNKYGDMESTSHKKRIEAYQKVASERSQDIHDTSSQIVEEMRKEHEKSILLLDKLNQQQVNVQAHLEGKKNEIIKNTDLEVDEIENVLEVLRNIQARISQTDQLIEDLSIRVHQNSDTINQVLDVVGF